MPMHFFGYDDWVGPTPVLQWPSSMECLGLGAATHALGSEQGPSGSGGVWNGELGIFIDNLWGLKQQKMGIGLAKMGI